MSVNGKQITWGAIGTLIAVVSAGAGGVAWYDDRKQAEHEVIEATQVAGDVELSLQTVNLEIKLLRTIQERRELTPDEKDRLSYLLALRTILIEEQRSKV